MPAITYRRFALHRCTAAILMALSTPMAVHAQATAETQNVPPSQATAYAFDIPAQPLGNALQAFARASRQQVSFDAAAVEGKTSTALTGRFTAVEAIRRLLDGTGVGFRRGPQGVWLVGPPQPAQPTTYDFDIPSQDLARALSAFMRVTGQELAFDTAQVRDKVSILLQGNYTADGGLQAMLKDTDLTARRDVGGALRLEEVRQEATPKAAGDATELEPIVVTGTRIAGMAPVGADLKVYDREQIDKSGAATVDEFARNITENFSNVDQQANTAASFGRAVTSLGRDNNPFYGSAFNLRGIGASATLTLLNGNRLSGAGFDGTFVDSSMIPLAAVEQIEVLADGASAIYGADAIAGVVNIITRRDFDGLEAKTQIALTDDGGGARYGGSLTGGKSWSSGNLLLSYQYNRQELLDVADRSYLPDQDGPYPLIPENDRFNVFAALSQDLGDSTSLSMQAYYSERDSLALQTDLTPSDRVETTGRFLGKQLGGSFALNHRFSKDWDLRSNANYSRSTQDAQSLGETSFPGAIVLTDGQFALKSSTYDAGLLLNGKLFDLPGGSVRIAAGGSYRYEDFSAFQQAVQTLDLGGGTSLGPFTSTLDSGLLNRKIWSAFTEINVPIYGDTSDTGMEVLGAVRYDHYDDFGDSTTWRGGLNWQPVAGTKLRASYGTSFRAPGLKDVSGVLLATVRPGTLIDVPTANVITRSGANREIGPETSTSFSGGIDFTPWFAPGLTAGVTYYRIDFDNRIGTPSAGAVFGNRTDNPRLAPFITVNPALAEVQAIFAQPGFQNQCACTPSQVGYILDLRIANLGEATQEGIDFDLRYQTITGVDDLAFAIKATHLIRNVIRLQANDVTADYRNTLGQPNAWRGRATAEWQRGNLSALLSVNYIDAYRLGLGVTAADPDGSNLPIGSWTTADLSLTWDSGDQPATAFLRNLMLNLTITNLTDERPPTITIPASFNPRNLTFLPFDAANASAVGRMFALNLTKRW